MEEALWSDVLSVDGGWVSVMQRDVELRCLAYGPNPGNCARSAPYYGVVEAC
jgi:hypothetical protein